MPETSLPISEAPEYDWENGSNSGGFFSMKRVGIQDKIRTADINQLRYELELLALHHHDFRDRRGC